ncbi:MAG: YncE family protein [Bryobacteraceae bacterium]
MKATGILLGLLAVASLPAQMLQIEGPVSGFVFDESSQTLRPIVGLPGAAYLGDPVASGLLWASVAPGGPSALALKDGLLFSLLELKSLSPVWARIENVQILPERAAWAEDGSAVLIYSAATGSAQWIRMSETPIAEEPLPLAAASALAVDRQGRVIAATPDGVFLTAGGQVQPLLPALRAAALAIAAHDLLVAGVNGEIWRVRDYAGQAVPELVAAVEDPVGVAASPDGKYLFVADRSRRSVEIFELASRAPVARLTAEAEPLTLARLSENDVWLLRTSSGPSDPLLLLKTNPEPGIWFVPAGKGE